MDEMSMPPEVDILGPVAIDYPEEVDAILAKRAWNAEKDIADATEHHAAIFHACDPVPDRNARAVFRSPRAMPVWLSAAKFVAGGN